MLIKVAWRNIWRNKLRSAVVMIAIALGIWAGIFASSLANGVNKQRLGNVIDSQTSHIQIHQVGFSDNFEIVKRVENGSEVIQKVREDADVKAVSSRTLVTGMVASAATGKGVMIRGVNPEDEQAVTKLKDNLVDGKYFEGTKRNPVLLGASLAKKLNVKLRSKLVVTFQNAENEIVSASFKVVGLYKTTDTRNDELSVYVRKSDLDQLAGMPDGAFHEAGIMLQDAKTLDTSTQRLKAAFPALAVESWKELIPGLAAADVIAKRMNYLLLLILLAALSFGIVNTMLMAVLERVREFGMLMAVGMNKTKVFLMIMFETVFLMLTGTPIGILLAWGTVKYLGKYGLDLSEYSEGFSNVGVKPIIYPFLTPDYYPKVIILVIIAAFLAAIYPAIKAIRLNPAEAIRKI